MRSLLQNSISPASRATYNSSTRAFFRFAALYNQFHPNDSLIPASEETLMLFTVYLIFSLKPQSIKVYLYGERNLHLENGFTNPLQDSLQLYRLLQEIKWTYTAKSNQWLLLHSFYPLLNLCYHDHYMIWAAMLLVFFGFLRYSEPIALTHHDLVRSAKGYQVQI